MGSVMTDARDAEGVADREAAEWHVRLGERPVSAATLEAFKDWRRTPANAEAWRRVENLMRGARVLSSDPDIQALTRNTLRSSGRKDRGFVAGPRHLAVVVTATGVFAALGLFFWMPDRNHHSTGVGEQHVLRLADGTQVRLDTDTRLRVRYDGAARRVILDQGQALFTVAHDNVRPFRVEAGETEVTALGTVFDVRRDPGGARVTLVSGSVAVSDPDDGGARRRWRLTPGQQVATAATDAFPQTVDPVIATSWTQGRLIFRNIPLAEAVAEMNRYLPEKIALAPGPLGRQPVNGVFATGDGEAFIAAVTDLFGAQARRQADGSTRLSVSSAGG
jgi:transmembrane sensor